jgi:hypothetical protein
MHLLVSSRVSILAVLWVTILVIEEHDGNLYRFGARAADADVGMLIVAVIVGQFCQQAGLNAVWQRAVLRSCAQVAT